jgi:hypothetical protein
MNITLTADQVNNILDNAGLPYESFTSTYSGRGMYGDQCVGFDFDHMSDLGLLSVAINEVLGEAVGRDMIENLRTDSMGLGMIAYFPHTTCAEWDEDEDEDDNDDDY